MLLKDRLIESGDFCFRHRTLQYLPYCLVMLAEFNHFRHVKESLFFEFLCFFVTLTGIFIRIFTIAYVPKNTSGRNRNEQIADVLNTKGMYSIVRNPLYLGNFFIFLGISMMTESWEIIIANSLLMIIFYTLIVLKEEEFLAQKFTAQYREWADKVNCFIPSLKHFEKTSKGFSLKKVIKNEHDTWLSTLICFVGIEIVRGYFEVHTFFLLPVWQYISFAVILIWFISKVLKKTGYLDLYEDI